MATLDKMTFVIDAVTGPMHRNLDKASQRVKRFGTEVNKSTKGISLGFDTLTRAAAGFLTVSAAQEVLTIADSYNKLQNRIKAATDSAVAYTSVSSKLFDVSQRTATSLESNVSMFQRLKVGAEELGRTDGEILRLVETVNKLGLIGGSSLSELNNATTQFSQAMAGGIVRAEEFNSIVENTPLLAKAIADGLGVSVGELRKMVFDGELLADDVFESILSQTGKVDEKFGAMGVTMEMSLQMASTAAQTLIGRLNETTKFTETIAGWLEKWAKQVTIVSEQMRKSQIFDQAEKVNEALAAYTKIQQEFERSQQMLAAMPANTILQSVVKDEQARLTLAKSRLDAERKTLEILNKQDMYTVGALRREGIPVPEGVTGGTGGTKPTAGGVVGAAAAATLAEVEPVNPYAQFEPMAAEFFDDQIMHWANHYDNVEIFTQQHWDNMVKYGTQGLSNLASLMNSKSRKMFEIGKVAAIAETAINTARSAMGAYAALAPIPVVGPALAVAAAGAAIAAGAVQIQNIKSQQFSGGGGTVAFSGATPNTYYPPQPTQSNELGADGSGKSVNLIFNGDLNGFDIEGLASQLGDYINQSDNIFIDTNSRTGLQFAQAI